MILPIVQLGHPVLRVGTRELTNAEIAADEIRATVDAMRETMHAAPGVGLAAPQVGLNVRLAVIEDRAEYVGNDPDAGPMERIPLEFTVLINATYEPVGDATREFFEGCLSMSGYRALVPRHHRIRAHWTDLDGVRHDEQFSGWPARIVQHEIDHLDGIVYVDRCSTRSLTTTANLDHLWSEATPSQVRRALRIDD